MQQGGRGAHPPRLPSRLPLPPAVFSQLCASGVAVYSYDAFGHGKSEGERAIVRDFGALVRAPEGRLEAGGRRGRAVPADLDFWDVVALLGGGDAYLLGYRQGTADQSPAAKDKGLGC